MRTMKDSRGVTVVFSIKDMPEMLAGMRHEMASILREAAEAEPIPLVATRLREIAAAFECGQREEF